MVSVSGASGAGGTVSLGDGTHNVALIGAPATGLSAPITIFQGTPGKSAAASPGGGGGSAQLLSGNGGDGQGTNEAGGSGGATTIGGGFGGASTGTAANSDGGPIVLLTGLAGTGGSGAAGAPGPFQLGIGSATHSILMQAMPSDYVALGAPATTTAQSGYLRFPSNSGTPVVVARNKGGTADDILVDSQVQGGTSYLYLGSTNDQTTLRAGTIVRTLCNVESQQGTSGPFFIWTRNAGQGSASSQSGNHLDDIGVVTVASSTTATAYTFTCPVSTSATVKITVCCRATGAPSGGALGDTYSAEVLMTVKNTVSGSVAVVGSATALAVSDSSLNTHVSLSVATFTTGEVDLKIGNTSTASLDCTMKVAIVFN